MVRTQPKEQMSHSGEFCFLFLVTELEVEQGLFQSSGDPNDKCLCFVRIIDDINKNTDHPKAWRYTDMTDSLVDQEAQKQLTELRDKMIQQKLSKDNFHR